MLAQLSAEHCNAERRVWVLQEAMKQHSCEDCNEVDDVDHLGRWKKLARGDTGAAERNA